MGSLTLCEPTSWTAQHVDDEGYNEDQEERKMVMTISMVMAMMITLMIAMTMLGRSGKVVLQRTFSPLEIFFESQASTKMPQPSQS